MQDSKKKDALVLIESLKDRIHVDDFSEETLNVTRRLMMILLEECDNGEGSDYESGELINSEDESIDTLLGISRQDVPKNEIQGEQEDHEKLLNYVFLGWYLHNSINDDQIDPVKVD